MRCLMANCPDISRFLDKIMTKLIICDIDNTLLFTDKLNNKAYIHAAKILKIQLPDVVLNAPRITASLIKKYAKNINNSTFEKLQEEKLNYFLYHLEQIEINQKLLNEIKENSDFIYLWTGSNERRALAECCMLKIPFDELISFDKKNSSVKVLHKMIFGIMTKIKISSADIIVYDDDENFLNKIAQLGIKTVLVK